MNLLDIINNLNIDFNVKCDDKVITGLNTLTDANESQISFLDNKKYLKDLENTKAAAVLIKEEFSSLVPSTTIAIITDEPYLKLAYASKLFAPTLIETEGENPILKNNCSLMENVYLGKNVIIGENSAVMHGSYISDNVEYSKDTILNYYVDRRQQGTGKTQEVKKKIKAQANVEKESRKKYLTRFLLPKKKAGVQV